MSKMAGTVLLVEDDLAYAESVILPLEASDLQVDHTDTRAGAFDLLQRKHYDVALVDLQLRDDITHKGGIDVLDYIKRQNEGTASFVLSGSPEIKDALRAYQKSIEEFVHKDDADIAEIVKKIRSVALERKKRAHSHEYSEISTYLCAPEDKQIWEKKSVSTLGCSYQAFQKVVAKGLRTLLPIIRKRGEISAFLRKEDEQYMSAILWGKGVGTAVQLEIAGRTASEMLTQPNGEGVITHCVVGDVRLVGTAMPLASREEFAEFVWDDPWMMDVLP